MQFLLIQFYQTGDVVLTSHIPRELKKICPDAEVDFLTFAANRPILLNNPDIRSVLTITKNGGLKEMFSVISSIRKKKYDAVLDFHNNPRSAYITFLSGAKYKVGYESSPRKFFYNTLPKRLDGYPPVTKLSLIAPFTKNFIPENHDVSPVVFVSENERRKACEVLETFGIKSDDFFVTVSPTHKRDTRRWNFKGFIDTAEYLVSVHGAKVILTYGPGEKEYIIKRCGTLPDNIFLMPELSLSEFSALIGMAKLHIGNDSAPHHIATAWKVPTFVVLGSSSSSWVLPSDRHTFAVKGMDCQPCYKSICGVSADIPCMSQLTFDMIKDKLENFIHHAVKQ